MENILLTFTGFQDPYALGLIGEEEQPGPILSLLANRSFDRVILFSTPRTEKNTAATVASLRELYPRLFVGVVDFPLEDPTDYLAILRGLRKQTETIKEKTSKGHYFVSVSSGTPQMHACWVLLAACGEIPARILNVRPQRFVAKEKPLISEADLTAPEFPIVRSQICRNEPSTIPSSNYESAAHNLGIVGDHPSMRKPLEMGSALAPSSAPILILGETGTGKELFARFVHQLSGRAGSLFIPLNCAAIPKDLVESVLFGHKKGAFTGAINDQTGVFDRADQGTLFLDEIGELPVSSQAKLLRVLQDGLVEPIGGKKSHKVDARIIAATNQDLGRAIRGGRFREDLYYRLSVGEIRLPPLRERKTDIPKLALHILDQVNATIRSPKRLSPNALARLENHTWPGNVRDLENVIERSARLARQQLLDADDLIISEPITYADPLATLPEPSEGFSLEEFVAGARKQLILRSMELSRGNQSEAARLLGITPQAVHKFLRKSSS